MIVQCTHCAARFRFDEEKVREKSAKVRCSKCGQVFSVPALSGPAPIPKAAPIPDPPPPDPTPEPAPTPQNSMGAAPEGLVSFSTSSLAEAMSFMPEAAKHPYSPPSATSSPLAMESIPISDIDEPFEFEPLSGATQPTLPVDLAAFAKAAAKHREAKVLVHPAPPAPKPASPASPVDASGRLYVEAARSGVSLAAEAGMGVERPDEEQQKDVNTELYRSGDRRMNIPPQLKALQEIFFDDEERKDVLELDEPNRKRGRVPTLQVRALSGSRVENAAAKTNFPLLLSIVVKSLIILCSLASIGLLALMIKEGDHFNPYKLGMGRMVESAVEQVRPAIGFSEPTKDSGKPR